MASSGLEHALFATIWGFRLLPLLVLGAIAYFQRERLRQPIAFWMFGVLSFHGIAWFVWQFAQMRFLILAHHFDVQNSTDKVNLMVITSYLMQFALASALSLFPVLWLHRHFRNQTD